MPNDSAKKSPKDNLSPQQYNQFKKYWQLNLAILNNSQANLLLDKKEVIKAIMMATFTQIIQSNDINLAKAIYKDGFYQPHLKSYFGDNEIIKQISHTSPTRTNRSSARLSKKELQKINNERLFEGKHTLDGSQYKKPASQNHLIKSENRKPLSR